MTTPTRILFVTSEIFPLVKTGGLADISGALPLALRALCLDVRVLVPAYPPILEQLPDAELLADVSALAGDAGPARLLGATMPGSRLSLLLLDCPALYARPGGPYLTPEGHDWPDNALRFGLLSQVGALLSTAASPLPWKPDVVHCNDWQSALIPALLHFAQGPRARSVMSIHNLMFQGNFDRLWVTRLGLPVSSYAMDGVEFYGNFSFLKAGIYYADQVTTVSRTYAEEIQTPEFGYGMDGLLRFRRADLHGIVNGIAEDWNPATDPYLREPYERATLDKKSVNKQELQRELGLQAAGDAPLLCMVSRLTQQKGIDLVLDSAPGLLQDGVQLAVLGSGDTQYEELLGELAQAYPGQVSVTLGYDEGLAHRIIAGGDIFLMPSRFEPCGLSQMYGMAYGTPPVVRRTGGLADTVIPCGDAARREGNATGFGFDEPSAEAFTEAVRSALACFRDADAWRTLQNNGMKHDFGWRKAAQDYMRVYRLALRPPKDSAKGRHAHDTHAPEIQATGRHAPEAAAPDVRAQELRVHEVRASAPGTPEAGLPAPAHQGDPLPELQSADAAPPPLPATMP